MTKCLDQDFFCQNPDYSAFNKIACAELSSPPLANEIINESAFCTIVPIDQAIQLGDPTYKDYLKGLGGKTGVYHLWIDYDECDDHQTNTMMCVYVGKGFAKLRIAEHIKTKWPDTECLYVSFYECSNRLAKYIEQLFLDTYAFHLNSNENAGKKHLFAVWEHYRHLLGTEIYTVCGLTGIDEHKLQES